MKNFNGALEEVNQLEMEKTMQWLTTETPYRLAGSQMQKKAAEYVSERMRAYGLETELEEFYAYNSDPISSEVCIVKPYFEKIDSLPCAHIKSTVPEGEEIDLVYVNDGSPKQYEGKDVKGKFVLVEVSYAPPVPEKARIAYEMGAAGIMCMNWGNDEEVICHRALKGVWGNPTEETFPKIPDIIGVGVTRNAGLKLKKLCLSGERVRIKVKACATRQWSKVQQPFGRLKGNGKSDDFLLVCSHLDAWKPGVTCNATGNATTLEICRILSKHRELLDRDVYFVFWSGHEIAEAAGSTWFIDNHWDLLNKHCVSYMHIDSTGVKDTKIQEIKASKELLNFSVDNYREVEGDKPIRAMALKKIGDQSFMGIGIPSVTQRISFSAEDMEKAHGATLGWWNHTCEDSLDKCDRDILVRDTKITLRLILALAEEVLLPYEFDQKFDELQDAAEVLKQDYAEYFCLDDLIANIQAAKEAVVKIQCRKDDYMEEERAELYNRFVMQVCRSMMNVYMTYADKFEQDSYGYSKLSEPIPLLADLKRLPTLNRDSLHYGMIHTQLMKNKNRILDGLQQIQQLAAVTKTALEK